MTDTPIPQSIASDALNGATPEQIRADYGLTKTAANTIVEAAKMVQTEFNEHYRTKLQRIIDKAADKIAAKIETEDASLGALTMAMGVSADKLHQLGSKGPQSVHLHLHGQDRMKLVGGMLGADAKRAEALIAAHPEPERQCVKFSDTIDLAPAVYAPPTITPDAPKEPTGD